jgi:hypothetical protein
LLNPVAEPSGVQLIVNRDTGEVTFNNDLSAVTLIGYSVTSASGAIDVANWDSIAATGDSDSGSMSVDPNDTWSEEVATATEINEIEPLGEGADDGAQLGNMLSIGEGLWMKSPFEDFVANITTFDGFNEVTEQIAVIFTGDTQTEPYLRSDFDFDNDIDADDWDSFVSNHLSTTFPEGTLPAQSYGGGDLNGDLVVNFADFRLFQQDYDAANGAGAFASLSGASVPEPSTVVLTLLAGCGLAAVARRR